MLQNSSFKLSPSALKDYRGLRHDENAERIWNIIPHSTVIWSDEHPYEFDSAPDDAVSERSIMRLVSARTALWLEGEIPPELKSLWEEAKNVIPDWPGFLRLTLTDEEKRDLRNYQNDLDALEAELLEAADLTTTWVDDDGRRQVRAMFRADAKPKRRWWKFWR